MNGVCANRLSHSKVIQKGAGEPKPATLWLHLVLLAGFTGPESRGGIYLIRPSWSDCLR
jgi:hypothetical protein